MLAVVGLLRRAEPVLPDLLRPGLKVVFCGTAAGNRSAERNAYYAGPGNRFWSILCQAGLTDRLLSPAEYGRLLDYGIGLTDLAKRDQGLDSQVSPDAFDRAGLAARITKAAPGVLAFNGKKAASAFFDRRTADVVYGRQRAALGPTAIYVLPSTSAAARGHWWPAPWLTLAREVSAAGTCPRRTGC